MSSHSVIRLLVILSFINVLATKKVYRAFIERVNVTHVNEKYMKANLWTVRLSRFNLGLSGYVNVLVDLSLDTMVRLKLLDFRSNEYRPSIINIQRDMCNFLKNEYTFFYPAFRKTGSHVPEPGCPVHKGNYTFERYSVSETELPMGLPFKKLKIIVTFTVKDLMLLEIETYGSIDQDNYIRERFLSSDV